MAPPVTGTAEASPSHSTPAGRTHDDPVADRRGGGHGPVDDALTAERGELLAGSETVPGTAGDDDRPDDDVAVYLVSASSSLASASSSVTPMAKVNSETRIWRALVSMRFSPAERPLSLSRIERFRTTSATW